MWPLTAIISSFNHFPDNCPCWILLGSSGQWNTLSLSPEDWEEETFIRSARSRRISSRCWTSRCVCIANFWIYSLKRSCLVDVDVSCSGFMEARSMRSLGLHEMANSKGVLPLRVTCVFLTVAALRINWAGVIFARVVWPKFSEAVSTSAEWNFLNNRTPISARFGQGVCGPVGSLFSLCIRLEACISWGWWKATSAQIAFGFIWTVSIHSWSLEMTSDGEVLLHGYAVECDVAPSKTKRKQKFFSPILVDPWSKKMRSQISSALNPHTRDLTEWALLHHMLVKVMKLSRNVQVSCPLLELSGRHLIVFQVKVPQISLIRQLFMMLRRASPSGLLPKI